MSFFSLTQTPSAVFSKENEQAPEPSSDHIDFCSESTSLFFFLAKRPSFVLAFSLKEGDPFSIMFIPFARCLSSRWLFREKKNPVSCLPIPVV